MVKPWFDPVTSDLLFDDYVAERPSYQNVLRDAMVSDQEIDEQADRVAGLFRRLEPMLDPMAKELATEALCELAVLNELQLKRLGLRPPMRMD